MDNHSRLIQVDRHGDVFCVRLKRPRLDESDIFRLADELTDLVTRDGCRKLALSLGPLPPDCLYSVFLAKLVTVQRVLHEHGGSLLLCEAAPEVRSIFDATHLDRRFEFVPDFPAAVAHWGAATRPGA